MKRPAISPVKSPQLRPLKNISGLAHCWMLPDDHSELCKLEMIFPGGYAVQEKPLQAAFTAGMMREGTAKYSYSDLAMLQDRTGGQIHWQAGRDVMHLSLECLNEHLQPLLEAAIEMLRNAAFPEDRFEIMRNRRAAVFAQNWRKPGYRAKSLLWEALFGDDHPYGKKIRQSDYTVISDEDCRRFHEHHLLPFAPKVFYTGHQRICPRLPEWLAALPKQGWEPDTITQSVHITTGITREVLPGAMQTSLYMGIHVPTYPSPDFLHMKILMKVLAGFFGSRLMQNLREDKGYTYGVGGGVMPMKQGAVAVVAGEVQGQSTGDSLVQIGLEMERLRQDLIPQQEWELVKHYYQGEILRMLDSGFDQLDWHIERIKNGWPVQYLQDLLHTLNVVTPEDLRQTAQKYLWPERWSVVLCGDREHMEMAGWA